MLTASTWLDEREREKGGHQRLPTVVRYELVIDVIYVLRICLYSMEDSNCPTATRSQKVADLPLAAMCYYYQA